MNESNLTDKAVLTLAMYEDDTPGMYMSVTYERNEVPAGETIPMSYLIAQHLAEYVTSALAAGGATGEVTLLEDEPRAHDTATRH